MNSHSVEIRPSQTKLALGAKADKVPVDCSTHSLASVSFLFFFGHINMVTGLFGQHKGLCFERSTMGEIELPLGTVFMVSQQGQRCLASRLASRR